MDAQRHDPPHACGTGTRTILPGSAVRSSGFMALFASHTRQNCSASPWSPPGDEIQPIPLDDRDLGQGLQLLPPSKKRRRLYATTRPSGRCKWLSPGRSICS